MKCPKCGGKGTVLKIIYEDWQKDEIVRSAVKCSRCNGSGEVMTEQEYLQTCNTEQLAEWIAKQKCNGCNDEPYDDKHGTCIYCMTKKKEQMLEWLKQPHTNG